MLRLVAVFGLSAAGASPAGQLIYHYKTRRTLPLAFKNILELFLEVLARIRSPSVRSMHYTSLKFECGRIAAVSSWIGISAYKVRPSVATKGWTILLPFSKNAT